LRRWREAPPGRDVALGQPVDPRAQLGAGGKGEVEAVAQPVGVDAEQPSGGVDHRTAGRAPAERGGVLQRSADQAPARTPEGLPDGRDEPEGDPGPEGTPPDREHRGPDLGRRLGPFQGLDVARRHLDHGQVAVDVGSGHGAGLLPPVGEGHRHLGAPQVVGVGDDQPRPDHDPGAAPERPAPGHRPEPLPRPEPGSGGEPAPGPGSSPGLEPEADPAAGAGGAPLAAAAASAATSATAPTSTTAAAAPTGAAVPADADDGRRHPGGHGARRFL
jgi:hypothetical protein